MDQELSNYIKLCKELDLTMIDETSPGSIFFLPKGQYIYNKLIELIRNKYDIFGYEEVSTPIMCSSELWKKSGHYDKYKEHMFFVQHREGHEQEFGLCPMNCPKHILIFKHMSPSYKQLPLRFADFGALHRNESSGSLVQLLRNRLFHQDDAHIFCTNEQINEEIQNTIKMMTEIYELFGFKYEICVSTKPDQYIGSDELWENAENILKENASKYGNFTLKDKDGAFYGPKIDIMIADNSDRKHQLGTIQLDFNLPLRFDLTYRDHDGKEYNPVMIHRAIFGSLERFIAVLIDHTNGILPLWLSPRKIAIIPVKSMFLDKCNDIKNGIIKIFNSSFGIDIIDHESVPKLVRNAEVLKYNYILVVGEKEVISNKLSVRQVKQRKNEDEKAVVKEIEDKVFFDGIFKEYASKVRVSLLF